MGMTYFPCLFHRRQHLTQPPLAAELAGGLDGLFIDLESLGENREREIFLSSLRLNIPPLQPRHPGRCHAITVIIMLDHYRL